MSDERGDLRDVMGDAALAAQLFAVDPFGLGGIVLRAGPGPQRDRLVAWVREMLPVRAPLLRVPLHVTEDRLLGGLSLAATLREGRVVTERGLLSNADGGVVVVAMAERVDPSVTSHLASALDRGELSLERDGITAALPCRIGVLALDEGIEDERAPAPLRDRLAFHIDFSDLDPRAEPGDDPDSSDVARARAILSQVDLGGDVIDALCQAASALGVASLRAPLLAATTARAHAALLGRRRAQEEDAVVAARLVLGPRATRLPAPTLDDSDEADTRSDDASPEPDEESRSRDAGPEQGDDADSGVDPNRGIDEIVLEAAKSAIPSGLLDALALGREPRSAPRSAGKAGVARASTEGGRPAGTRAALPRPGERLNVVETLRAAAPWQRLRRRAVGRADERQPTRVEVRKEDFRVTRFQQRTETCVIFTVDASGSSALQRLAEAKGAVEQVLADCYARRDHVALIAFRGAAAALLLPPTRSLARVRRCLADLAGGGTTPVALGIDAALALAVEARKRGRTPVIVVMTDGRANVARDGRENSAVANEDALASARAVRAAGVRALFLDTSPRPRPQARALAGEMGARYLPLPYLDSAGISRQVQSLAEALP